MPFKPQFTELTTLLECLSFASQLPLLALFGTCFGLLHALLEELRKHLVFILPSKDLNKSDLSEEATKANSPIASLERIFAACSELTIFWRNFVEHFMCTEHGINNSGQSEITEAFTSPC
mmetsp:Transcript_34122/g.59537  ORF Transcript_34122/g.59537 Transcript_34122/m.59537 type:complete len:120 (+) Transcript_34122:2751-3110(+)